MVRALRIRSHCVFASMCGVLLLSACTRTSAPEGSIEDLVYGDEASAAVTTFLLDAERELAECLREQGYDWEPFVGIGATDPYAYLVAPMDLDHFDAQTRGYGVVATINEIIAGITNDPNRSLRQPQNRLTEAQAFDRAYRDCSAGVDRRTRYLELSAQVDDMMSQISVSVLTDPRLETGLAAWSECMDGAGFSFASPLEAVESIRARLEGLEEVGIDAEEHEAAMVDIQADELELAPTDSECRASMEPALTEVRTELEAVLVRDNSALFEELLELRGS